MMQRVWILTVYFTKSLFFSLTGLILLILSLVYWVIFFPPGQGTPDAENYIILIAAFGAAATFVAALSLSGRASRLENYPLLVRLPSRVEYLVAVLFSSLLLGIGLQLLVAGLALIRGPDLSGHALMTAVSYTHLAKSRIMALPAAVGRQPILSFKGVTIGSQHQRQTQSERVGAAVPVVRAGRRARGRA